MTEETTAVCGKTLTTFPGWDTALHYTAQGSSGNSLPTEGTPRAEAGEEALESREGRAGLTP